MQSSFAKFQAYLNLLVVLFVSIDSVETLHEHEIVWDEIQVGSKDAIQINLPVSWTEQSQVCCHVFHRFSGILVWEECVVNAGWEEPKFAILITALTERAAARHHGIHDEEKQRFQVSLIGSSSQRHAVEVAVKAIWVTSQSHSKFGRYVRVSPNPVTLPAPVILWPPYGLITNLSSFQTRYLVYGAPIPDMWSLEINTHKKNIPSVVIDSGVNCNLIQHMLHWCIGNFSTSFIQPGTHALSFTLLPNKSFRTDDQASNSNSSRLKYEFSHMVFDVVPSNDQVGDAGTSFENKPRLGAAPSDAELSCAAVSATNNTKLNGAAATNNTKKNCAAATNNTKISGAAATNNTKKNCAVATNNTKLSYTVQRSDISITFVGTLTLDGQRTIWASQMHYLCRSGYHVQFVSFIDDQLDDNHQVDFVVDLKQHFPNVDFVTEPLIRLRPPSSLTVDQVVQVLAATVERAASVSPRVQQQQRKCPVTPYIILDLLLPKWSQHLMMQICGALDGSNVVAFGNSQSATDKFITACANFVGAKSVMELPNLFPAEGVRPNVVVAPSYFAASHESTLRAEATTTVVIHPGVDVSNLSTWYRECASRFPTTIPTASNQRTFLSNARFTIGFVGRLEPEKSTGMLLHAVRSMLNHEFLSKKSVSLDVVIVGNGSLMKPLQYLTKWLKFDDASKIKVTFTGVLQGTKLRDVMSTFDVLVNPSLRAVSETFCIVNIEAMAMGIPIVSYGVGGVSDYLMDRTNSILVHPKDDIALGMAVTELLQNETLRCDLSRRALQDSLARFNSIDVMREREAVLHDIGHDKTMQSVLETKA